jgi:predicted acetyltransferase
VTPGIRAARPEERARVLALIDQAFGGDLTDEAVSEEFFSLMDPDRVLVADDGGSVVGGAGAFGFRMGIPGGELGSAGITIVAVAATHRRRGLLTATMRLLLEQARERGEALAALFASESHIYGRYGFGGHDILALAAERARIAFRDPPAAGAAFRLLTHEEALATLPPVWDRARASRPGTLARSPDWWAKRRLADRDEARRGAGPLQRALLELDGRPAGYALYRIRGGYERHVPAGTVDVAEIAAATPVAERELWRHVFAMDLCETVRCTLLPPDHALPLLVTEPNRLHLELADGLWLRVVDAEAALAARAWGPGEDVVLGLVDAFCPWNEGRWRVPGGERTDAEPDLRVDAESLGAAYLGGTSFTRLAHAGRVEELRDGAAARADDLFRVRLAPWSPEVF